MPNDFLEQFRAGFQMGQSRNENSRRNQELQMEQQRQQQAQEQRAAAFQLQQEEFALRKKQLAAEEHAARLAAAKEAFQLRTQANSMQNLPPPTAADVGIPQQGPEMAGPPVSQVNVPQPMQAMPNPMEGQPDIQMPVPTGPQQQAMAQAEQQRKMRELLGMETVKEGVKAKFREPPKSIAEIFAEAKARAAGGRAGAPPEAKTAATEEYAPEDVRAFPTSWRDTTEGTRVQESYTTRNNNRATAMNAALQAGAVLPSKKGVEEAQTAQQLVAQAERIKALLEAPVDPQNPNGPKAKDFFGPAESRLAGWRQAGFGPEIPPAVIAAREAVGRFAAKDRHAIYGAAVTPLESKFAATFIADMNSPGKTLSGQLDAYIANITNGMDSTWGQGTKKKLGASGPAEGAAPPRPPNVPPEAKWDAATRRWRL